MVVGQSVKRSRHSRASGNLVKKEPSFGRTLFNWIPDKPTAFRNDVGSQRKLNPSTTTTPQSE